MADAAKLPSLTVLGGPRAGTRFVIEDAIDEILIGSDPGCGFSLDLPGVSPIHARVWVDLSGITIYDTKSPHGVFVNDDRVGSPAPLHNGDILWLGPPGGATSTMLQCRIPTPAPELSLPAAAPTMIAMPEEVSEQDELQELEPEPELFVDEPPEETGIVAEEAAVALVAPDPDDAMRFELDHPPPRAAPLPFEEDVHETDVMAQADEIEPAVMVSRTAEPTRVEAPRPPSPRPEPAAPAVAVPLPPARKPSGRGLALGLGAVVLAAAAGLAYSILRPRALPPTPPARPAAATLPPAETPSAPVGGAPAPAPEPTPVTPSPAPLASPSGGAAPPSPRPAPASPAPVAPPQAAAAARVAGLLGQAQSAAAGGNYDAAIAHYDEVLKLDPQSSPAQSGKAAASSARLLAQKSFVTGRTVVQAGKAKASDFSGRLELAVSPARPKPGDSYTLQIALVNDGKKTIKVSSLTVSTMVNGSRSGGPMAPRVREVGPQKRAVLEELPGVWRSDVTSWSAEARVTAGKDESLSAQVSWGAAR